MRVNCQMNKVLHIPNPKHWDKITNLLFRAGLKYASLRDENIARTEVNTLAFNREFMWLTTQDRNPDRVFIGQDEIDQITLLEHSPEAVLEWLFNL